ncbi:MAG: ThiF family adenylyltransferase [Elusimicrobia bacterium]|nr:ThiF family adenylyltransferase [Candidatus Omnitrophota bacterium]MCG2725013.1 ThiF family adenylyltransferase [Elusimicrobiota bacterium]
MEHILDNTNYYEEAFNRNIGLTSEPEQQRLKKAVIAIPGAGGVGGIHLLTLARMGIGHFRLADFDIYETANINRQYGANTATFGKNKAEVMAEMVKGINPDADVAVFKDGITPQNIDSFLEGADIGLDGLDYFAPDARRLFFNTARKKGIPVITAAPLGFGCALIVFTPEAMSFDDYFGMNDHMSKAEKILAFTVGISPKPLHLRYMDTSKIDFKAGRGPALASSCVLCASMASTAAVGLLLKRGDIKPAPFYTQYDPYLGVYRQSRVLWGAKNPFQTLKRAILRRKFAHLLVS